MEPVSVPLWEQERLRLAAGETLRPGGFALTDRAAEAIGVLPGWRVLDVGCGLGATMGRLRSRYGARAWGVEPSAAQIERAVNIPGIIRANGDALPFASGAFDALFCECVFSLFSDKDAGLREFCRVLRPEGYLVLSDLCSPDTRPVEGGSCADRAEPVAVTRAAVEAHGFSVLIEEDHSRHLRNLAARLAWAGEQGGEGCGCGRRLGYYLLIAQKRSDSHDPI